MAQCAEVIGLEVDGTVHAVLAPSSVDPCVGLVLLTPGEFAHITANPWVLTLEQGAGLSVAIAAVWAAAWAFKSMSAVVKDDGSSTSQE